MALTVIEGGSKPKEYITCPKCGCMTFIEMKSMIRRDDKRKAHKTKACAACFAKGLLTEV